MEDGGYELDFLRHTFGEFLDAFVPPGHDFEAVEPVAETACSLGAGEAFELGEVESLLADAHLTVETALLGEVADAAGVVESEGVTIEGDRAGVGGSDGVYYTDEGGFAGTIGTEEAED